MIRGCADRPLDLDFPGLVQELHDDFLEPSAGKCGLRNDAKLLARLQGIRLFFGLNDERRIGGPFKDALNLRMFLLAYDDDPVATIGQGLADMGAGGIHQLQAPFLRFLIDLGANAMGTDDDRSLLHFLQRIHRTHALRSQAFHHLGVVDDRAQCTGSARFLRSIFPGNLDCPLDSIAESQVICQNDFHTIITILIFSDRNNR